MKSNNSIEKYKLQKIVDLLKFILTLDDKEITQSSIEYVIDFLEEEINSSKKI